MPAAPDDPRLGKIDAVLISHLHGDHLGHRRIGKVNDGTCAKSKFPVILVPQAHSVQIAHAKKAKIVTGSEMPRMLGAKLKALGGNPKDSQLVRFGALRKIGGVAITTVPAARSSAASWANRWRPQASPPMSARRLVTC